MASEKMIFAYCFANLAFPLPWQPINSNQQLGQNWCVCLRRNISVKFCQNICSEIAINTNFNFSHYKSMATVRCHSNQTSYPTGTKNKLICSPGLMKLYVKFGKNQLHSFRGDVIWKCWTDGGRIPAYTIYKLTYEPLAGKLIPED